MSDDERWVNSNFPCHSDVWVEEILLDPLQIDRTVGARCPACEASYRVTPRVANHPLGTVGFVEWTIALANGETCVIPPQHPNFLRCDAPLYADPPWEGGPIDPRRKNFSKRWLPAVRIDDVNCDGYDAVHTRLREDCRYQPFKRRSSLIVMLEPVRVHDVEVIEAGEVVIALRHWVRHRPDRVVVAHARAVDHGVVVSRNFGFIGRPLDNPAQPDNDPLALFDTAQDRP